MRLLELFPIEKKEKKKDRRMKRGEDSQREKGKRGKERREKMEERERERTRTILGIEVYKAKNNISPFVILFGDTMINISIIKLQI